MQVDSRSELSPLGPSTFRVPSFFLLGGRKGFILQGNNARL